MKKHTRVIAVAVVAFVMIGGHDIAVRPAMAQDDGVGFDIAPHHIGISVPNLEDSIAWYREMLGFEVVRQRERQAGSQTALALLQRDDCYIELFEIVGADSLPEYRRDPSADLRVHGTKHFSFQVADALAATDTLRSKGAEIAMGPVDNEGAIFVFIRDNSGNTFELIQYKTQ